jgi:type VI secretion system secreted protein VgrG
MFAQTDRPIQITTPLSGNNLVVLGFSAREAVSELFHFRVEAMWQDTTPLAFDQLLGQKVTITLDAGNGTRYFNGVVNGIAQCEREETSTRYRLEMVPSFWTLTRVTQSRIFQQKSVPDILKAVLTGLDTQYSLTGTYDERDYCVQYRESDFAFACRLMEEEGIFYFFQHTASGHTMVVGDSQSVFQDLDVQPEVIYEELIGGSRDENRIIDWEKVQGLRSGKSTLWDYNFELPDKHLEASQPTLETVQAGTVAHKLKVGGNDAWELYEYPGGYAKRPDGVTAGGGDNAADLQKIFTDNARTVGLRMQQETLPALTIFGTSNHGGFTPGYTFTLQNHFSDDGEYVLLSVQHEAKQPLNPDSQEEPYSYNNRFTAIPAALPYRPARTTPIPFVHGVQTAVVVGPAGAEIYPDKYSRVKVQFPWDRAGTKDSGSSCWLRVATQWAGTQWGTIHIPRVGQEVIVGFMEGDPDQPIIVGSVYNADNMPPYTLPDNKTQSGIKSRSSLSGTADNFNEIRFEDKKGSEDLFMHAEKDMHLEVENDRATDIGHDETRHVVHDRTTNIDNDETKTVKGKETITITGNQATEITQGNQSNLVDMGNQTNEIKMGNMTTTLDMGNQSTELKMGNQSTKLDLGNQDTELMLGNVSIKCDLGSVTIQALQGITLMVGPNTIKMDLTGVTINGLLVTVQASAICQIQGAITMIN